jgi:UDP-N-acetylmuramoylalanine--D-glutamate ligase
MRLEYLKNRLEYLKNRKILILGFGKEGRDSFRFLRKLFPTKVLGVGDRQKKIKNQKSKIKNLIEKDKRIKWHLGEDYLKALKDYDLIIKSPGIPIHLPEIEKAFKERKITSQTEIFFSAVALGRGRENCPAPLDSKHLTGQGKIVGITGTKGKGTTATLIYKILREGGLRAHLVGNIEKPVLQFLFSATPKDIYVFELSSHQLYNLRKSPQIAVFLNLYPAHLDFFRNFREYVLAKANITRYQNKNDYLIYDSKDKIVREIAKKSKAKKIPIPTNYEYLRNIRIPLVGKFNFKNIMAAVTVGKIFGIPDKKIIRAIKKFKPLPHRLEFVGTFKGIKFYNDSLATIPESAVAAIEALGDNLETIILGGSENNVNPQKLAKKILESKIKNLILFPTTGEKIWKEISGYQRSRVVLRHFFVNNMAEAVKLAYQWTGKGKICLLSPAYPSFSLFKDYKERGNLFKKYVRIYGKG